MNRRLGAVGNYVRCVDASPPCPESDKKHVLVLGRVYQISIFGRSDDDKLTYKLVGEEKETWGWRAERFDVLTRDEILSSLVNGEIVRDDPKDRGYERNVVLPAVYPTIPFIYTPRHHHHRRWDGSVPWAPDDY